MPVAYMATSQYSSLITFIQLDIHLEAKIEVTLESISSKCANPSSHEEISGSSDHRKIPSLVIHQIRPHNVQCTLVLARVEHQGVCKPSSVGILHVVEIEALSFCDGR